MAVYKRGYQRYTGLYRPRIARWLAFPRFSWRRLMDQRLVVITLILSLFFPLAAAAFVYLANRADLWEGIGGDLGRFLEVKGQFFLVFLSTQGFFAVLLAALAGPGLVAPDLANGALPLYFSRPLSRLDYVLARLAVLFGLLSLITWIPGLLLFAMQSGMAGWDWFAANWRLAVGVFFGFTSWTLLIGLVALASSAYVRWRIIAGAVVLAFFFVLAGASEIIRQVMGAEWARALNPTEAIRRIWSPAFGIEITSGPGPWECALSLSVMALLLCWVLERKLRAVEVVS